VRGGGEAVTQSPYLSRAQLETPAILILINNATQRHTFVACTHGFFADTVATSLF
jgi:hypothetical protein